MSTPSFAYVQMGLAMAIVGSSVVCGKIINQAFPVFLASGLRFALAALIMIPLVLWREGRPPRLTRGQWLTVALMAFCGQFMFTCLLLLGLRWTSAVDAGLITSTTPAAMTLLSLLLLGERPGPARLAGVLLALAGVVLVNQASDGAAGEQADRWLGNLLLGCAVAGEAVFLLLRKRLPPSLGDLGLTALLCLLGLVMFLPPALYQAASFDFSQAGPAHWWSLVYFGVVFTVVAYLLWFGGVAQVDGSLAGIFTAIMPLSALTLSVWLLGEPVSRAQLWGAALVVIAIACTAWPRAWIPAGLARRLAGARGK